MKKLASLLTDQRLTDLCSPMILKYSQIYGVIQAKNRAKWTIANTTDDEISQKV